MKIGVCGDVHFSQFSSIVRGMGDKYSLRLENLIKTLNWAESEFEKNQVDFIVYLGDFFDRENLNSMEISALKDIVWSTKKHYFIVGNHEASVSSLIYNSTQVLSQKGFTIIDKPTLIEDKYLCLPYITESDRNSLDSYLTGKEQIIFSHNDIKGVSYGHFESKTGFDVEEINKLNKLFINGHIHNKNCENNIINLGNITGQNFSENAFKYPHQIMIIEDEYIDFIDNPFAFNFYKIEINTRQDLKKLDDIKDNAVLAIHCNEDLKQELIEKESNLHIIAQKCTYVKLQDKTNSDNVVQLNKIDHLSLFKEFILTHIENSDILLNELGEVCK